jgi:5-hydroxyisourate hydrolase-like protein (transthyretin family)
MKSTEINVDLTDEQLENLKECKYHIPLTISPYSPDLSREKEYNKHNTIGA